MQKSCNNFEWHRIGRPGGPGVFALSVAFCLAGLLALSSCGDNEAGAEAEPIEMRGFYISVNADYEADCQSERVQIFSEGNEVVEGKTNITLVARGTAFGDAYFPQIGVRVVDESNHHPETIVSVYVSETGEIIDRPGSYFLAARTDSDIPVAEGETIYTGYWSGYAYRPGGETAPKPAVVCPYVLVPASTDVSNGIEDGNCGTEQGTVHSALAKYLEKEDGVLLDCLILLDPRIDDGILKLP